jgi:uncharacterized lipoprotein YddW (UPF0748 family)
MLKAVWLTNVDSQIMHSRANLATGLDKLARLGFDTIYPAVWQRGYTLYPSEIAQQLTGEPVLPDSPFTRRDLLAEIVELAAPLQMRVIPWFEYGLMVPPRSAIASNYPELLTLAIDNKLQRVQGTNGKLDPNAWLNPCDDRVCQFITDLITDVVRRYPVDGIQLDDHFAFPQELGYDRLSQQLFRQDLPDRLAPKTHSDPIWIEWGSEKLTNLLTEIVASVRSIRSNCTISISPNPLNFSRTRYLADWQKWHELGLIDELVLQVYRDRLGTFQLEINKPEVRSIQRQIPTLIAILTGLRTKSIDSEIIAAQIKSIADRQFAGYACFFYETIFYEQLSPTLVSRNPAQLSSIFGV